MAQNSILKLIVGFSLEKTHIVPIHANETHNTFWMLLVVTDVNYHSTLRMHDEPTISLGDAIAIEFAINKMPAKLSI